MVSVEKFYEAVRLEGLNTGIPCTFVKLGPGRDYPKVEELVYDILQVANTKWVVVFGADVTHVGMGSIAKGLWKVGFLTEFEIHGSRRDPGWIHSVTRWTADFVRKASFNYAALRSSDSIRFVVKTEEDLEDIASVIAKVDTLAAPSYIKFEPEGLGKKESNLLAKKCVDIIKRYERVRLY